MRGRYEPVAVTAAITGGDVLPSQSEFIPCGPEAIVAEGIAAAQAGATIVHVHGREEDGRPTADPAIMKAIVAGIRGGADVLVNVSTGGAPGMSEDERLAGIRSTKPDLATLNLGTMTYESFPDPGRRPVVQHDWEREMLAHAGEGVFVNTLNSLRRFATALREAGVVPELEAYDAGHLRIARQLIDEGTLVAPVRVQLVLGVLGGAGNDLADLFALKQTAERVLGDDLASLGVAATGYPMQLRHAAVALSWGMDCRVGLEDSIRVTRDRLARSNAELVEAAAQLARLTGRPLLRPNDLRAVLRSHRDRSPEERSEVHA